MTTNKTNKEENTLRFDIDDNIKGERDIEVELTLANPEPSESWEQQFLDLPHYKLFVKDQIEFIKFLLLSERTALVEEIKKYTGKVYGLEIVVSEDLENKNYIRGFEDGKKFVKEHIITLLTKTK